MNKKRWVILITLFLFALVYFYFRSLSSVPDFFPINDPKAEYQIIREDSNYYVKFRGDDAGILMKDSEGFIKVLVGATPIDLDPYLSQKVLITQGKFTSSSKQCLAKTCHNINGPQAVLNIYSLNVVK